MKTKIKVGSFVKINGSGDKIYKAIDFDLFVGIFRVFVERTNNGKPERLDPEIENLELVNP